MWCVVRCVCVCATFVRYGLSVLLALPELTVNQAGLCFEDRTEHSPSHLNSSAALSSCKCQDKLLKHGVKLTGVVLAWHARGPNVTLQDHLSMLAHTHDFST